MAERITESPPSATDRNGQVFTTTTTIIELQQSPPPSSPPSPPPPQITITSPPPPTQQQLFQRHNSIFCFDNAAYADEENESDFEVFEDAETAVKVHQQEQEDEEYAFEPELRFRVGKRSSSLVTFFRSFNPSRKTVTISEPEMTNKEEGEEEVDSRRKSSTKMPPRSSSPQEPQKLQKPRSAENQRQKNNSHSTSSDFIPKPVPFKAPKRWIPFFSLVSFLLSKKLLI